MIKVFAFDFDGCLFHSSVERDVVQANKELLELIKADLRTSNARPIVMIASNRQSIPVDGSNARKGSGSCFSAITKISAALNIFNDEKPPLDDLLLADVHHDLEPGSTLAEGLKLLKDDGRTYQEHVKPISYSDWFLDDGKLTIVLAQVHKIAAENADEEIEYHFYDDLEDILLPLHTYFKKYPNLIPKNVTLHFHRYTGPKGTNDSNDNTIEPLVFDYEPISGTGITKDYKGLVKNVAAVTVEQSAITNSHRGTRLASYSEAKSINFDFNKVNCIKIYLPEMKAKESFSEQLTSGSFFGGLMRRISSRRSSSSASSAATSATSSSSSTDLGVTKPTKRTSDTPKPILNSPLRLLRRRSAEADLKIPNFTAVSSEPNLLAAIPEELNISNTPRSKPLRRNAQISEKDNPLKKGASNPVVSNAQIASPLRAQSAQAERTLGLDEDDSMESTLSSCDM